jgi:signal transduction histidine kinase
LLVVTALLSNKLFSELPDAESRQLQQVTREISLSAGDQIFKEGDPGDGVYFIKSGQVQISALVESGERYMFSKVGPGEMFGEMAVLDEKPRSASATADTPLELYFVPREFIAGLLTRSPEFTRALVHEISSRLREFNRQYIRSVLQIERLSLVGRFASSIVHDLKNPLTIINMATDLACSDNATPATRKMAKHRIRKQVDRITYLVNDILEFTRGSNLAPVLTPTDFAELIAATLEDLREELQENKVTLEIQSEPPKVKVAMNPKRLGRVFHNLIGNAIDEMPRGGAIKLRFTVAGGEIISEIEDTGRGIAPEILDRLFEAFATHGKSKGTGLGLSICQRIIEEHGGKISARNQQGGGAIFSFTLPMAG